jgi:hypothetical protein
MPRERKWMDDNGNITWVEFTVEETEVYQTAVYPVLAQWGTWKPANGEPFVNPAAASMSVTNGVKLQFGGVPYQAYILQRADAVTGPWNTVTLAGTMQPDSTGTLHFTDPAPVTTMRFYRAQMQGQPGQVY